MNRENAAELLQQGYKLKHQYFSDDEYISIVQGVLRTEDNYNFHEEFWTNDFYKDGWSISPIQ